MIKQQFFLLFAAIGLFAILFFGFDTKGKKIDAQERSRSIQGESTGAETLLEEGLKVLSTEQASELAKMEEKLSKSGSEDEKINLLKKISGFWFRAGKPPLAGIYAEQVAELEKSDTAWSVAGATFFEGLIQSDDKRIRDFCSGRAIKAFESAVSFNPKNIQHSVNIALVKAENPSPDNPMAAALMLRELAEKYPNDPAPFNALGRLAIKTGQWGKAVERLERARTLDKDNLSTPCLLAKAYEGMGNATKAAEYAKICNQQ